MKALLTLRVASRVPGIKVIYERYHEDHPEHHYFFRGTSNSDSRLGYRILCFSCGSFLMLSPSSSEQ